MYGNTHTKQQNFCCLWCVCGVVCVWCGVCVWWVRGSFSCKVVARVSGSVELVFGLPVSQPRTQGEKSTGSFGSESNATTTTTTTTAREREGMESGVSVNNKNKGRRERKGFRREREQQRLLFIHATERGSHSLFTPMWGKRLVSSPSAWEQGKQGKNNNRFPPHGTARTFNSCSSFYFCSCSVSCLPSLPLLHPRPPFTSKHSVLYR